MEKIYCSTCAHSVNQIRLSCCAVEHAAVSRQQVIEVENLSAVIRTGNHIGSSIPTRMVIRNPIIGKLHDNLLGRGTHCWQAGVHPGRHTGSTSLPIVCVLRVRWRCWNPGIHPVRLGGKCEPVPAFGQAIVTVTRGLSQRWILDMAIFLTQCGVRTTALGVVGNYLTMLLGNPAT